jgi:tryptophan 2,3-dioxygenase
MARPAVWSDDPECGHDVDCAYQTHYCTYIRVPRLLTLQTPVCPDELLLITALQWYELWFKVLLIDLKAAHAEDGSTYEPIKLLRRGIELFKLFDLHADLTETILVRELGLTKTLRAPLGTAVSEQFSQILKFSRHWPRSWASSTAPELREAAREYTVRLKAFRMRYQSFLRSTLTSKKSAKSKILTYAEWLHLPELLNLQEGVKSVWAESGQSPTDFWKPARISPDEMMFIIVHQCFELWFKATLDQIDQAIPAIRQGRISDATRLLRRVVIIQRLLVQQIQIPATMLALDFFKFRDQKMERDGKVLKTGLSPASGTESYQFREIEIVCGLRDDPIFQKYLAGTDKLPIRLLTPRQRERLQQPTLIEAFRQAVQQRGLPNFEAIFTPADVSNPHGDLAQLADTLIEFDQFFHFWRLGHVSMVEKMIGARSGTGFLGPEYLMETAGIRIQEKNRIFEERQVRPRFFEELWVARTRLGSY